MASIIFNKFFERLGLGELDLDTDTIKCALLSSTYTGNETKDSDSWSDVSTYEVSGTGYVAGGEDVSSVSMAESDANDNAVLDGDDVSWTSSTITARWAVLYDDTHASDALIAAFDFGTDKSTSGTTFTVEWHTDGILTFAQS